MRTRTKKILLALSIGALCLALASFVVAAAGAVNDWWVIASEGGPQSGGKVELNATLGQPIIGPSAGSRASLGAGYWYGLELRVIGGVVTPLGQRDFSSLVEGGWAAGWGWLAVGLVIAAVGWWRYHRKKLIRR